MVTWLIMFYQCNESLKLQGIAVAKIHYYFKKKNADMYGLLSNIFFFFLHEIFFGKEALETL